MESLSHFVLCDILDPIIQNKGPTTNSLENFLLIILYWPFVEALSTFFWCIFWY